ncbi:MAG TPA: Gfo/Idh/MocA family oxidoreductase [Planctomycetaceae bacterium]|nr:Gfo/Idh/MocA family oxidoreductase [Planctomycetaceae bacterium]
MKTREFLQHEISRRQFLGSSAMNAAGVAAGMVGLAAAAMPKRSASERVRLGVIGVRSQGRFLAGTFAGLPDADVAAVCDVDENVLPAAVRAVEDAQGRPPVRVRDFRRLLDDPSIDAVVVATPDHWHALMTVLACQAGKDVYVEMPVSHNLREGEQMVAAAARHDRIVQAGLHQRSGEHFRTAVEMVRGGGIGDVRLARAWIVHRRKPIGVKPDGPAPRGVDYDLWLGPAPTRPFNPNRFHHNWHWFWDYGTGELGNWGSHLLDVARWGLGVDWPTRIAATGGKFYFQDDQETPDTLMVNYEFTGCRPLAPRAEPSNEPRSSVPDHIADRATDGSPATKTILWEHRLWSNHGLEGRSAAVAFYGENGTLVVDRGGWKVYDRRETITSDTSEQAVAHCRSFIDAVKTREQPAAGIELAHVSSGLCHLGNVAYRLGREVAFDPETMTFGADASANSLLVRDYRRGWELPIA